MPSGLTRVATDCPPFTTRVIFTSLVLKPFIMLIATTPETSWCSAATTSPKSMAFSSLRVGGGGRVGQGRAAIAGKGGEEVPSRRCAAEDAARARTRRQSRC